MPDDCPERRNCSRQEGFSDLMEKVNDIHHLITEQRSELAAQSALLRDHKIMLVGDDGREGIVKDVNDMKTGITVFKWIAGTGLGSSLLHWITKISGSSH